MSTQITKQYANEQILRIRRVIDIYISKILTANKIATIIFNISIKNNDCIDIIVYDVIGYLESKTPLKTIVLALKNKQYGSNHQIFESTKLDIHNQDQFTENPFEVIEGISTCICGCKKVFTYQVQTRSCDESASTHNKCTECGNTWVYSG